MDSVLSTDRLHIAYKNTEAVHNLSLEVERGTVVGLIGPDGAGKTSTLRVLAGLLPPTSGKALAFGRPSWKYRRALHHKLGYLAQRFALYGDLTVHENIRFFATTFGVKNWQMRRDDLLNKVGLSAFGARRADQLSGGMKQKLALACTLMHSPEVLLLDEPTTGVDPVTRREFWRLLGDLIGDGLTLVIATPYLDEAERCHRVVLMHEGRVLAEDAPARLPEVVPGQIIEIRTSQRRQALNILKQLPEIEDLNVFGSSLHARFSAAVNAIETARSSLDRAGIDDAVVEAIPPGLEDAFLYLTRRAECTQ